MSSCRALPVVLAVAIAGSLTLDRAASAQCVEGPNDTWTCTGADADGLDATTNAAVDTITVQTLATVANAGQPATISMIGGTCSNAGTVSTVDLGGTAIFASGAGNVTNTETIQADCESCTGVLSISGDLDNSDSVSANGSSGTALFAGSGDVTNSGTVSATGTSGVGIFGGDGDNTVTNSLVVTAGGADGIGIFTGPGGDTVLLGGSSTTTGGLASVSSVCTPGITLAVCTGDDDDSVVVIDGASVLGTMDGGAGSDSLGFPSIPQSTLDGLDPAGDSVMSGGNLYEWVNFEELLGGSEVSIGDLTQNEGTGGTTTFTFTLTRTGVLPAATVDVSTADGGAVSPGDFAALTNVQVSFAVDQAQATFDVSVVADPDVEPNESFTVTLSNPSAGLTIGDGTAAGTIVNDDATVSIDDVTLNEGTGGTTTFTFSLTRTGALPAASVQVSTVDGSAVSPADFAALSGVTVNFAVDQVTATVDVSVVADGEFEADQTFTVVLSNPSAGLVVVDGEGTGTIVNDDSSTTEIPTLDGMALCGLAALLAVAAILALRRTSTSG